jgi:hypothetical protein
MESGRSGWAMNKRTLSRRSVRSFCFLSRLRSFVQGFVACSSFTQCTNQQGIYIFHFRNSLLMPPCPYPTPNRPSIRCSQPSEWRLTRHPLVSYFVVFLLLPILMEELNMYSRCTSIDIMLSARAELCMRQDAPWNDPSRQGP